MKSILALSFSFALGAAAPLAQAETPAAERVGEAQGELPTATDQGDSDSDVRVTQEIRSALVERDDISMRAKNVQVITRDGQVTLRGVVEDDAEKQRIDTLTRQVTGVTRVDNHLEIDTD